MRTKKLPILALTLAAGLTIASILRFNSPSPKQELKPSAKVSISAAQAGETTNVIKIRTLQPPRKAPDASGVLRASGPTAAIAVIDREIHQLSTRLSEIKYELEHRGFPQVLQEHRINETERIHILQQIQSSNEIAIRIMSLKNQRADLQFGAV